MNFKNIIRLIAKEHGVTPAEVKKDMQEAIRIGMSSTDPVAQAYWKRIAPTGKEPTIEEFLAFLTSEVRSSF